MSTHRLRARLDRVQQRASTAIGQDRAREPPRHVELAQRNASATGLGDAEKPEGALEARLRADQDRDRFTDLFLQKLTRRLTDAEQIELDELDRRFPNNELEKAIITFRVEHGQL